MAKRTLTHVLNNRARLKEYWEQERQQQQQERVYNDSRRDWINNDYTRVFPVIDDDGEC